MLDALKAYLTEDVIEDWAQAVLSFPLGFKVPGEMRGYDEYIIRGMVGGRDDVTGSVTIPTEVSRGTSVWLMRRDQDKLLDGVGRIVEEVKAQLGDDPAQLVFQFDCAGRGKIFLREQQRLQLQNKLRGSVGPDVPWLGFYTFGEISPVGGRNHFHNYTVVLTVVY
jgi:small ligand-binding sensory domain FIST